MEEPTTEEAHQLTGDDIVRLGVEAGARVLAMGAFPTQRDIDDATLGLRMRAVELRYRPTVVPDSGSEAQ